MQIALMDFDFFPNSPQFFCSFFFVFENIQNSFTSIAPVAQSDLRNT